MRFIAITILLVSLFASPVAAHESQPGTLEIRQQGTSRYAVTLKLPLLYGQPHPARMELPTAWQTLAEPTVRKLPKSSVHQLVVNADSTEIEGAIIRFPGLEGTVTDILVRLTRLDGTTMTAVVRPTRPSVELRGERSLATTARDYIGLGFHHIMLGVDHLLFVLGLLLIVQGGLRLVKTITFFTIAHSITLAMATIGLATVPLPPLNAAVALSILFLGPEIVRSWHGESSLTIRNPWLVAFAFGLLHGFGFASGLSTTGMPKVEIPLALLFFNIGVEFGQLSFVAIVLLMIRSFRVLEILWPRWVQMVPGYMVGSLGAFWTIQRTAIMLRGVL